jgi:hypothetical protein
MNQIHAARLSDQSIDLLAHALERCLIALGRVATPRQRRSEDDACQDHTRCEPPHLLLRRL